MNGLGAGVIIFRSPVAAECRERALVLKAMSIEHAVGRDADEWILAVPEDRVAAAARELDEYARESRDWLRGRRHPALPRHRFGWSGVVGYLLVLLLVAAASSNRTFGLDWFGAGRIDTDLVRQGEWWRAVTALTLHLDAVHLVGNLLLGSVFALVAGRLMGNGLAWFSIVVAGAVGNEISALVQLPRHTAVGASTAVFAALGLVAACSWRRRDELQARWPMRWGVRWAPIIVAVVLLAYTGSGSERTDVVSHLTGFLAGIALGAYYGGFTRGITLGARGQCLLGMGALAVVAIAWAIALGSHG